MPLNSPKRSPYWNSTSGFDFCHITAVDMSSAPVCEISSKSDYPRQKKITSCRFSRCRISVILDFRGLIMGSLKSPCTTSYRSSIETMALNCLVFEKIADLYFGNRQTDRQTDEQMDRLVAWSRFCCRERRLNKGFTPWHAIWRANDGSGRDSVRGDAGQVKWCVPCRGENLWNVQKFISKVSRLVTTKLLSVHAWHRVSRISWTVCNLCVIKGTTWHDMAQTMRNLALLTDFVPLK